MSDLSSGTYAERARARARARVSTTTLFGQVMTLVGIAIAFGSPYLLKEIPSVGTYFCVYGIQPVMQLAAVHRNNVVARFHIDAGLRERSFIARIPILSVVYLGNPIAVVFQAVVGAQQSDLHLLRLWRFSAAHEHVADRHLSQALLK